MAIRSLAVPTTDNRSGFRKAMTGTSPEMLQHDVLTPDQIAGRQQFLQRGLGIINDPYQGFQPIADLAYRNFNQQVIPSIMERFTALGSGAQRSSAFGQALGGAGADLESQLAAQRSQYGMQNMALGQNLANMGMQRQFDTNFIPGRQGFLQQLLQQTPELATRLGTAFMTGGMSEGFRALSPQQQPMPQAQTNSYLGFQASPQSAFMPQNFNQSVMSGILRNY